MPIQPIHVLQQEVSLSELNEVVAKLQRTLKFLLEGNIDSDNTREIGGWLISQNEMVSKDGDVGMSTEDTLGDDVRFWAGSTDKNSAPWRVTKSGKMHATGATIESKSGYPKVVFDPDGNIIAAYADPVTYVAFIPTGQGNVPSLSFVANNTTVSSLNRLLGTTTLVTFGGEHLNFQPGGNLQIDGQNCVTGGFWVSSTPNGAADTFVSFNKGMRIG